jgi:tetratricopeptide (TPR) repeat protein
MKDAVELKREVRQLMKSGQLREAAAACDELNQQYPEYVPGWIAATELALRVDEPVIATRANERALKLAPGRPMLLLQRIECLTAVGDTEGAIAIARQFEYHQFDTAGGASSFGLLLSHLQLYEQARKYYLQACELEPAKSENYYNVATVERFLGNNEAAEEAIEKCLELRPDDADAHLLRSGLRTQTEERNNVRSLLDARELAREEPRDKSRICYALSKELEDIGDYGRAFEFLAEGASLRRSGMNYNPANDLETMREIRRTYTSDLFAKGIEGHISAEPIFIIGMPRTGTTLVERILGSHSVVRSAGELHTFATELLRHCRNQAEKPATSSQELVRQSVAVDFAALGEDYITKARPPGDRAAHFVDKLPLNFLYAGLIQLALPKARIVLLERDPMDTCYAVFKTMFEGIYPFSYDLEELAHYFAAYKKLVDHWRDVMPDVMHVVSYENLVTNPEPEIEDLLQYCGLSFEEGCRKFFDNPEASTTASADAVRSDFFTSSIGKWRNYEEQLRPVAEILESER